MSQAIDPIDIEARLRVRYPEFNWNVIKVNRSTLLHITGNMPSRSLTEVINLEFNQRPYDSAMQSGDRVVNALLQSTGLNSEVRVAERILRRYCRNVRVLPVADGSMLVEIDDPRYAHREYPIASIENVVELIQTLIFQRRDNHLLEPSPQAPSPPPAQEYRCVTSVMLDRSMTL